MHAHLLKREAKVTEVICQGRWCREGNVSLSAPASNADAEQPPPPLHTSVIT